MEKENKVNNLNSLFIVGIALFAVGLATDIPAIWITGLVLFVVGIGKRKKWFKKNEH